MNRAGKTVIAALAMVLAVGAATAKPATAGGDTNVNLNPNHCQTRSSGAPRTTGTCRFVANVDADSSLYIRAHTGSATATVTCGGGVVSIVSATAGNTNSSVGWANPGGSCVLTLMITGSTLGSAEAWTWP
jgi:hypothetical protein